MEEGKKRPDFKIGLSISGGGFRAASFGLGTLSYLEEIDLLDNVIALSTISGGTITGTRFAVGQKVGEKFEDTYAAIYDFLQHSNLLDEATKLLKTKDEEKRKESVITAFAECYQNWLFKGLDGIENSEKGASMDLFLEGKDIGYRQENPESFEFVSFNAAEFSNALQFRFKNWENYGNYYYEIPEEVLKNVRMGDILAASACFPLAFEPIMFPDDFELDDADKQAMQKYNVSQNLKNLYRKLLKNQEVDENDVEQPKKIMSELTEKIELSVGLMDGGIVDNQGIEPLEMLDKKIINPKKTEKDGKGFDLLMINDVSSYFMDNYQPYKSKKRNVFQRISSVLTKSPLLSLLLLVIIPGLVAFAGRNYKPIAISIVTTYYTMLLLLIIVVLAFRHKIPFLLFDIPTYFSKPAKSILKLRISKLVEFINNRANSFAKLNLNVFLIHIRRLIYDKIYEDDEWKSQRIMNAIYELKKDNVNTTIRFADEDGSAPKDKSILNDAFLTPNERVRKAASIASSMDTTLWYTEPNNDDKMPAYIIACGQFTACWNLLDYLHYLEKPYIEKEKEGDRETRKRVLQEFNKLGIKDKLMDDWIEFNKNPFWLHQDIALKAKIKEEQLDVNGIAELYNKIKSKTSKAYA